MTANHKNLTVFILSIALAWISYSGNHDHVLLHWDDITYISTNPWITHPSWLHLKQLFTEIRLLNWHPLTWLSYIPEYYFFADQASTYKASNIFLHGLNSYWVYCLARLIFTITLAKTEQNTLNIASLFAAILFVIHPQHVESTIWVAERKDLLCATFYLSAIISYLKIRHFKPNQHPSLAFILFVLAILSKSMAITLPFVLLALDLFLLKRITLSNRQQWWTIVIWEKLPFYLVSTAVIGITLISQQVTHTDQPLLLDKLIIISAALNHYLYTFIYPFDLSPFYPVQILPKNFDYMQWGYTGLLLVFSIFSVIKWRYNALLLLSTFLIIIAPVIGIIKVGNQAFADRYSYLPMVGFYLATGHLAAVFWLKKRYRLLIIPSYLALTLLLINSTNQYKNIWKNDLVLWQFVENKNPSISPVIADNLANSYYQTDQHQQAEKYYKQALSIDKTYLSAYRNLASLYQKLGNIEAALQTYKTGVINNPENPWICSQAGDAFLRNNRFNTALNYFQMALKIQPNYPEAILGISRRHLLLGHHQQALKLLQGLIHEQDLNFEINLLRAQAYAFTDQIQARKILASLEINNKHQQKLVDRAALGFKTKQLAW